MKRKILVVDDELHIIELVRFNLENSGFKVLEATNGQKALNIARQEKPDLVLLDLMLPIIDGYEVCKMLRKNSSTHDIPIIMLTAKSEEADKILGFKMGADDYITKPFSIRELMARVRAVLRRSETVKDDSSVIDAGDIILDVDKHEVTIRGVRRDFTPKQFELLKILLSNPGKVFSREYLLQHIWGYDYLGDTRTVDVHIRHLRQKIEKDSQNPMYIETIRGVGYKFNKFGK